MHSTIKDDAHSHWANIFEYMATYVLNNRTAWRFLLAERSESGVRLVNHPLVLTNMKGEQAANAIKATVANEYQNILEKMQRVYLQEKQDHDHPRS